MANASAENRMKMIPLLVSLLLISCSGKKDENGGDAAQLRGTWRQVAAIRDGRDASPQGGTLHFGPEIKGRHHLGTLVLHFRYRVHARRKRIEVTFQALAADEGRQVPLRQGLRQQRWKYFLFGDELTIYFEPGERSIGKFARQKKGE